MITVHRLQGQPFVINAHLIMTVEAAPDTVISLVNGQKFVVRESVEEIVEQVVAYRRRLGLWANEYEAIPDGSSED